jgi:TRAP-type C4-dicarboxylate transport system substrate-binding protein
MLELMDNYLRTQGIVQIGGIPAGPFMVFSNKSMRTVADWQGVKVRAAGVTETLMMKQLGASPVTIVVGELSELLRRGTIDAVATDLAYGLSIGLGDVTSYVSWWEIVPIFGMGLFMNADTYDSLPPNIQAGIKEAGRLSFEEATLAVESRIRQTRVWLLNTQSELEIPDKSEIAKMGPLLKPVYEEWLGIVGPEGREILKICSEHSTGAGAAVAAELGS